VCVCVFVVKCTARKVHDKMKENRHSTRVVVMSME
jgi:hypothetical protein